MRCLEKNKVSFWYCPYLRTEPILDGQGRKTSEKRVVYGAAVQVKANVSPAGGEAQTEMFGNLADYDKVIVLENQVFPMDENSVLFVDKLPELDTSGNPLFDYIVKKVARSLNSVSYAIKKDVVS